MVAGDRLGSLLAQLGVVVGLEGFFKGERTFKVCSSSYYLDYMYEKEEKSI